MQRRSARPLAASVVRAALGVVVLCLLAIAGCDRPRFQLTVTFPGPPELEEGALVRYRGIPIGGVAAVSLTQPTASEPAQVALTLVIDDPDVVLREGDVFEVASDAPLADRYLRVIPAPHDSPPLEPGARVAGRPSLEARVVETTEQALERLGVLAREQAELLVERLSEQFEEENLRPDAAERPDTGERRDGIEGEDEPGDEPDVDPGPAPR